MTTASLPAGRFLVTGAAGFIGSHVVDYLLRHDRDVVGYDNLSSGRREWLEPYEDNPRFALIEADVLDYDALRQAMRDVEVVVHLASNTDIPVGLENRRLDLDQDAVATWTVLEGMKECGVRDLIFSSSSTVMGDPAIRPTPETIGPLLPQSLYGAGKLSAEAFISAYSHLFDIRAWIFRFGNVVGAKMGHGVILDFIRKLEATPDRLEILGDGKQEKNYFLVEDCVEGIFHVYRAVDAAPVEVFNLGNSSTITVDRIAEVVMEQMGLTNVRITYTGGSRGWPGDVPKVDLDLSRVLSTGWKPSQSSLDAVRTSAQRLLDQRARAAARSASSRGPR